MSSGALSDQVPSLDTVAGENRGIAERYSREIDTSAGDEVSLLGD